MLKNDDSFEPIIIEGNDNARKHSANEILRFAKNNTTKYWLGVGDDEI